MAREPWDAIEGDGKDGEVGQPIRATHDAELKGAAGVVTEAITRGRQRIVKDDCRANASEAKNAKDSGNPRGEAASGPSQGSVMNVDPMAAPGGGLAAKVAKSAWPAERVPWE